MAMVPRPPSTARTGTAMSYGSHRSLNSVFSDVSHVEEAPHPWWESQGPPAAHLPDGWKRFYDELSGQWYYVHSGSQKSTWVRPRADDAGALALPRLTQTQRAYPRRWIDKPTTYAVSSTSVPDPKLCSVETTVAVGPLYPKRIVPLPAAARSPVGIPTVPSRVDPWGVYHPLEPKEESSHRVQSRWVNLPPPAPLVPVHRPAWDDRAFWALCGESAESAQRYEELWTACAEGDEKMVQHLIKQGRLDPSTPVPLGWDVASRGCKRGSTPLHLAVEGGHLKIVKFLLGRRALLWPEANAQYEFLQPQEGPYSVRKHIHGGEGCDLESITMNSSAGGALSVGSLSLDAEDRSLSGGSRQGHQHHRPHRSSLTSSNGGGGNDGKGRSMRQSRSRGLTSGSNKGHDHPHRSHDQHHPSSHAHGGSSHHNHHNHHSHSHSHSRNHTSHGHAHRAHSRGKSRGGDDDDDDDGALGPAFDAAGDGNNGKMDIVVHDNDGLTPLMIAAGTGSKKMVHALLAHDPSERHVLEARDLRGAAAAHWAAQGGHVAALDCLVKKSHADLSALDHRHVTPLLAACRREQTEVVDWLMAQESVGWDVPDVSGTTPFMVACAQGNLSLVQTMIDRGSYLLIHPDTKRPVDADDPSTFPCNDADAQAKAKSTTALYADESDDEPDALPPDAAAVHDPDSPLFCKLLPPKHHRVWVDRPDASGRTPLSLAAQHGHSAVCEVLLTLKGREALRGREVWLVDLHARNGGASGNRPMDWARENKFHDITYMITTVDKQRIEDDILRRKKVLAERLPAGAGPGIGATVPL